MFGAAGGLKVYGAYADDKLVANRLLLLYRKQVLDWFAGSWPEYHGRYLDEADVYEAELEEARSRGLIT